MTDPVKPRRKVASQISLAPSPSPIASSSVPSRVRAHVTSSANSSPASSSRPALRSTPSALSLHSTPVSKARSPVPPVSVTSTPNPRVTVRKPKTPVTPVPTALPSRSVAGLTPKDSTPAAKARVARSLVDGSTSSAQTPRTPDIRRSNTGGIDDARTRTLSLRNAPAAGSAPIARVRTSGTAHVAAPQTAVQTIPKPPSTAPSPSIQTPPAPAPLDSPDPIVSPLSDDRANLSGLGMDDGGLRILQSTWRDTSPERISDQAEIHSNRSSPSRRSPLVLPHNTVSSAQHALQYIFQHPTASAPTSPLPPSTPTLGKPPQSAHKPNGHAKVKLPYNPHGVFPPSLPPPPHSPELRTVALPSLTPARSSEEWSRTTSSQGYGSSLRKYSGTSSEYGGSILEMRKEEARDRLSGMTAVAVDDTAEKLGETKIGDQDVDVVLGADAEEAKVNRKIADLEISNKSLLAINKTLEATKSKQRTEILKLRRMLRESLAGNGLPTSFSSLNPLSPSLNLLSPSTDRFDEDMDPEGAYFDEEMADPQLEARWEKIADLVGNMKRRGEAAVEQGKEEIKPSHGRVLDWTEIEQNRKDQNLTPANDLDMSVDSLTPNEAYVDGGEDSYAGETWREEVDDVI
ncbi:uncharacterized protein I303_100543 [Kwoniella dejecticola CBS 10117]|uniref:Uncharacterized protein n=1 Tax=Kwoniella dejecticola CBS 10117 TaxID=1296121 RepID=A0A1A6AF75_9TREE|nr:uncharacterized protein I303_00544 [Kwoniella dejecticola CBS 10117]OBR88727.1 hypothetical protein I303_00544 [Kwoniella dejecticola CBS 10117]